MDWRSCLDTLPDDRSRAEFLEEVLRQRDEADADGSLGRFVEMSFTPTEARIVARLVRAKGAAVPYSLLICAMKPRDDAEEPRSSLGVHVCHIRRKLRRTPVRIETMHGYGLRLNGPVETLGSTLSAPGPAAPTAPGAGASPEPHDD